LSAVSPPFSFLTLDETVNVVFVPEKDQEGGCGRGPYQRHGYTQGGHQKRHGSGGNEGSEGHIIPFVDRKREKHSTAEAGKRCQAKKDAECRGYAFASAESQKNGELMAKQGAQAHRGEPEFRPGSCPRSDPGVEHCRDKAFQ